MSQHGCSQVVICWCLRGWLSAVWQVFRSILRVKYNIPAPTPELVPALDDFPNEELFARFWF